MSPSSNPRGKLRHLRERLKEEARGAILEAAEQVLAEQGHGATRMEDIAARVGVSAGTLYNYFEDRRGLLRAVREAQGQQLRAVLDAELARSQGAPYRARLEGLVRVLLEHAAKHSRFLALRVEEARHGESSGEDQERRERTWSALTERIGALTPEGLAQGVLRPEDAAHYPTLLMSMVHGLVMRELFEHRPLPVDAQLALLMRCFLEGALQKSPVFVPPSPPPGEPA